MSNIETAKAFIEAFSTIDLDQIIPFFADDAVYHNIPVEPVQGKDAIRAVLQGFMGSAEEVVFETPYIAETANGDVLTERLDRFKIGGKWLELGVMGTFQFDADGKITHWRDYFDMAQFQTRMAEILGG